MAIPRFLFSFFASKSLSSFYLFCFFNFHRRGQQASSPAMPIAVGPNVILMRFFFIRYVKTSFVNFGPRPLFHQWPPGGALAVNSVNKSLFHGQFLGTRPKSNAILVFKAISNFVNF